MFDDVHACTHTHTHIMPISIPTCQTPVAVLQRVESMCVGTSDPSLLD